MMKRPNFIILSSNTSIFSFDEKLTKIQRDPPNGHINPIP
jgi:hypothetical protein